MVKKITKNQTSNLDKLEESIISKVVNVLKPELQKEIQALRLDITNDLREQIDKIQSSPAIVPSNTTPTVPNTSTPDLSSIMTMLKDGNLDMTKISQLINQVPNHSLVSTNGQPMDMSKLTDGQIEFIKMEQQNKMIMTFLPLLLQNQGGTSGLMGEVMQRLLMDKINAGIHMEKMIVNKMVKDMGGEPMPSTNLSTPTSDMINQRNILQDQQRQQQGVNNKNAI